MNEGVPPLGSSLLGNTPLMNKTGELFRGQHCSLANMETGFVGILLLAWVPCFQGFWEAANFPANTEASLSSALGKFRWFYLVWVIVQQALSNLTLHVSRKWVLGAAQLADAISKGEGGWGKIGLV